VSAGDAGARLYPCTLGEVVCVTILPGYVMVVQLFAAGLWLLGLLFLVPLLAGLGLACWHWSAPAARAAEQ
jgi:hypothetical protein